MLLLRHLCLSTVLVATHIASAAPTEHFYEARTGDRTLPLKVYLPDQAGPRPIILYSHGLGGSRNTKQYLLNHWAEAGFVVVAVQHPGSDASVWKDAGRGERLKAMKQAASATQFLNRTRDVPAVLDQLEKWNTTSGHALHARLQLSRVGMSGHSFGAVTTQAVMGTRYPLNKSYEDERFNAFFLMSPSRVRGLEQSRAFGHITAPVLSMTGTKDSSIITPSVGYEERAAVYHALPEGDKYMYVFKDGKHDLFSGPKIRRQALLPEHKRIQDISLLFWQAYLLNDKAALDRLATMKATGADTWMKK